MIFVKAEFMITLLYWFTIDCIAVHIKWLVSVYWKKSPFWQIFGWQMDHVQNIYPIDCGFTALEALGSNSQQ